MKMTRVLLKSILPASIALIGCGSSDESNPGSGLGGSQGVGGSAASGGGVSKGGSSAATTSAPATGGTTTTASTGGTSASTGGASAVTTTGTGGKAAGGAGAGGEGTGGKLTGGTGAGGKASGGTNAGTGGKGIGGGGPVTGGSKAVGGTDAGTGGKAIGGGGPATGGTGGKATGGVSGDGGKSTTGGSGTAGAATGGNSGTGGGGGGDEWGTLENPSASCTVGAMPSVGSLTANNKLPAPFKKMDGTAMTSKSEWRCRREEILRQGYEFIYGKKPATPASAVSGTVSGSQISVSVNDGGTATFKASVSLPTTGTAPYPAVITYSGVASNLTTEMKNRGVAVISYQPYDVGSESSTGTGAFYSVYGRNHEAGLLTAWAWGVSRIIDVLEKNPGTIDPYKIAVTGCSRFGKGALIAGAFDGRVALTIPMESGIGGTPALRLIEQLDTYSGAEWPYHAISYEPWFSPTKLGQFTTGNSASADNTNKLPVDTHEIMALILPRGLYIVDNPSTNYNGLDRNSAYATAAITVKVFEALGLKNNLTYQGASGGHCQWRTAYTAPLVANIEKFLLGNASAATGTFATDLGGTKPNPDSYMDFTVPTLSGDL